MKDYKHYKSARQYNQQQFNKRMDALVAVGAAVGFVLVTWQFLVILTGG